MKLDKIYDDIEEELSNISQQLEEENVTANVYGLKINVF